MTPVGGSGMLTVVSRRSVIGAVAGLAIALCAGAAIAQDARPGYVAPTEASAPVISSDGMVVAQERWAARIGAYFLAHGGNAVDAAVATSFSLAVTYPRAGNLGGGGFMVIHLAPKGEQLAQNVAIDYRETAPAATTGDIFLGPDGKPDPKKSRDSALGIGVPGTVAGLTLALEKYGSGKFSLSDILAPAIALANDGIVVTDDTADSLPEATARLTAWPASAKIFLHPDGTPLGEGEHLVQTDLAETLAAIANAGSSGFYEGPIADKIVDAVRSAGGILSADDLRNYQARVLTPLRGSYRGYDIIAMPLPSSGGVSLLEMLNILERFDLHTLNESDTAHVMVEAMKRAYADRAHELGDPAFVDAPVDRLISKDYAATLAAGIDLNHATPASDLGQISQAPHEGSNTTHLSVVDRDGNAVSTTTTLNFSYGLGLVADGTGVLLNNELDDFTSPLAPNFYGLIGSDRNEPAAGKKPLSSMAPTIVLKDGRPVLITGSPGGSRIITTVLQVIVDVLDRGRDVVAAVAAPRLHNQWQPDEVRVERNFPQNIIDALRARGDIVREPMGQTSANSIAAVDGGWEGAPDPRTRGATAAAP